MALTVAAERYPRYGFKKLFQVLRRQGNTWNHKSVHRIYCLLKLNFCRKGKQPLPVRNPAPLATPEALFKVNRTESVQANGPTTDIRDETGEPRGGLGGLY